MCGIAGFTGPCDPRVLDAFLEKLHHRGPDQRGTLCSAQLGLANNRLAIIDLAGGQQPIYNEDRTCAIVFNGEIYNYMELRAELQHRHKFSTESDTEVILHLYEEKGTEVPQYLKGDFAFCIWDSREQWCFLSRDPLGVKPLFYSITSAGNLVFSSELSALLLHPDISAKIDLEAVMEYLTCLYISAPRSLVDGVRKLGPGMSLLWKSGSIREWKYWHIPDVEAGRTSADGFERRALDCLRTAVRRRLVADVPVGAFLSGGLDSSLIVALASEQSPGLQTFSIGYGESDFDELHYARQVSRRYHTLHHEFVIRPDARELLEEVIAAMDEPIADSSAIPTYLVARETRRSVKVALSGVGGDELFYGYPRYLGAKLSTTLPAILVSPIRKVSKLFSSHPSGRDVGGWVRRFGEGLGLEPARRYWLWTTYLDRTGRESFFAEPKPAGQNFEQEALELFDASPGSFMDKIFRFDLNRYLVSNLLKFGDNMTMAHSLEMRVPFCDVDLVGEVARAPAGVRFPGYRLKSVLRKIAKDYLPPEIVRRKKQGFMIPIGRWFRDELAAYLSNELTSDRLPPFFDANAISQLLREHIAGHQNHTHSLWAVLVITRWLSLHPEIKVAARRADPR